VDAKFVTVRTVAMNLSEQEASWLRDYMKKPATSREDLRTAENRVAVWSMLARLMPELGENV
jgi:hypothetical protein